MPPSKDLKAGFTGDVQDGASNVADHAKSAATYVKREAGAVAASAQDHPSGTTAVLLVFGAAAFFAGYLIGARSEEQSGRRYW